MLGRLAILGILLLAGCAMRPRPPDAPGPWDRRSFNSEIKRVGETRFPMTIDLGDGYRVELKRNPYGGHGQCSRIWMYKFLPDGNLAGYPHSFDECP
jgi:hypothetical protein